MVKNNSKDLEKLLKKLNYDNWEEHAAEVAHAFFSVGSLVDWYSCGGSLKFGIVTSISDTGKITVQKGEMPIEKTTDVTKGGIYAKFWYSADKEKFQQYNIKTRFRPRGFMGENWEKTGYDSPIEYIQIEGNRMLVLSKPKIVTKWKKDLIMYESHCP